jgi:hypothetical protein
LKEKKEAKKCIARKRYGAATEWYKRLNNKEGKKAIYRIAKGREKWSRDITEITSIKDKEGRLLVKEEDIKERWKTYFEELLNTENEREFMEEIRPTKGSENEIP